MVTKLNDRQIHKLLSRGVAEVIIDSDLRELLKTGIKLRLKEGFDPSFPDIHLGHMVALKKLRQFQDLGHQVVLIVGDWTARIGDPTGASVTRPMLSAEKVEENAKTYMEQFFQLVDKDRTEIRWQSEWFSKFNLSDIINLTSNFTIRQMLTRDDFARRYTEEKPITVTELLYPMLQAYDSVAIKSDVEFGGTDQKFNLLVGRELQNIKGQHPQQVLLVPLLTGTDGTRKMSKSLDNYIGITEAPEEIFGKLMSINDELVVHYYELLTDVPQRDLDIVRESMDANSVNPMELKKDLAREIIIQLYDSEAANKAAEHFRKVIQSKEFPDEIIERCISLAKGDLRDVIVSAGFASSKSEATRLINQGAVSIDGHRVEIPQVKIQSGCILKVGKRRFARIIDSDILNR